MRRGNVLEGNLFTRIRNTEGASLGADSVQAVYLDDQLSGHVIRGNTLVDSHVGWFVGGGRDVEVTGNGCYGSDTCVHIDNRGMNWQVRWGYGCVIAS